jgi:glycerate kinase
MRVLVAPDSFSGTLTAPEAAAAVAAGWARRSPRDVLDLAPMSDGGAGFVDVVGSAVEGELLATTVRGPHGSPVPAAVLLADEVAWVESAQVCGRHLVEEVATASSRGLGELVAAAVGAGAREIRVGLGGVGTLDGGAGMLAALGAVADAPLDRGVAGLSALGHVDTTATAARLSGVRLVAASDVDRPLTGLFGTVRSTGPELGLAEEDLPGLDAALEAWAGSVDRRVSLEPGAGAAGGLGYALMLLGAVREPGVGLVARAVDLERRARAADLVLTGEGALDFSSRSGTVPHGVAEVAVAALRPCVALAGRVDVGAREMRALGIESAYGVVDLVGEERALADPAGALADLAERVARTWSR